MYNTSQLYELSFVAPQRKPRTKPQIVFTVKTVHLEEIVRRLDIIAEQYTDYASEYCYGETVFIPLASDLFGNMEFGYGRCGLVSIQDDETRLSVELGRGERLRRATLTIKLLAMALAVPIETHRSNRLQQVDLNIHCGMDGRGYDHAMSGCVSVRLTQWLLRQAASSPEGRAVPVPREVTVAMRYAWVSVCEPDAKRWISECGGRIEPDGRFVLGCLGAGLAIFPDTGWRSEDMVESPYGVRFGCHNLDHARQQATLLAGFAKMCELARKAENA